MIVSIFAEMAQHVPLYYNAPGMDMVLFYVVQNVSIIN